MGKYHISIFIDDNDCTSFLNFESVWMRSIFFGFFSHKTNIWNMSHSCVVKLTIVLAVFDNGLIHSCIASIWNKTFYIFQLIVSIPHLSTITDNNWHGSINNNVTWNMKVCYSFCRVDHSNFRSVFIDIINTISDIVFV